MLKDQNEEKFRTLKMDNAKVKERIVDMAGAAMFLKGVGFEILNDKGIMYAKKEDWDVNLINEGLKILKEKREQLNMGK